jgi:hypothetical protein
MRDNAEPSGFPIASSVHHACWTREEAAMAAITFNAAHQKEHVRERLKTVLIAFREMLDAFVSDRIRRSAAEAEHVRPRLPLGTQTPSMNPQ